MHRVGKTKGAVTRAPRPDGPRPAGAVRPAVPAVPGSAKRAAAQAARPSAPAAKPLAARPSGAAARASAKPPAARPPATAKPVAAAKPPAARSPAAADEPFDDVTSDDATSDDVTSDDDAVTPASSAGGEQLAIRDIARLLRYGERIGGDKIDVRMLPLQLHARSGALAVCDPARPDTWRVLERPIGNGAFRVMLSIARADETSGAPAGERLAAAVIHVGRPPIARWTVAQFRDQSRPAANALPRTSITGGWLALLDASDGSPGIIALPPASGVTPIEVPLTDGRRALALPCGNGAFAAYWAVDADDKPICVVIDFDAFTQKAWKAVPTDRSI